MTSALLPEAIARRIHVADSGCWEWTGQISENGYGRISVKGRKAYAHRVTYSTLVGPVPSDLELDHLCRNKACCNPEHLEPVTHAENMRRGANQHRGKTHCIRGHEFTPENTRVARGKRNCRACHRIHNQTSLARKAA